MTRAVLLAALALSAVEALAAEDWATATADIEGKAWIIGAPTQKLADHLASGSPMFMGDLDAVLREAVPALEGVPDYCKFSINTLEKQANVACSAENQHSKTFRHLPGVWCKDVFSNENENVYELVWRATLQPPKGSNMTLTLKAGTEGDRTRNCKPAALEAFLFKVADTIKPGKAGARKKDPEKKEGEKKDIPGKKTAGKTQAPAAAGGPRALTEEGERRMDAEERAQRAESKKKSAAQLTKAVSALRKADLYYAETAIDISIEADPGRPQLHFTRAGLMRLMGKGSDFETSLARARELDPELAQAPGALCRRKVDPKTGQQIQINPKDACMLISEGLIREAGGDKDGARQAYDHAIALSPQNWLAYAYRGILRSEAGACPAAHIDFDAAVRINPQYRLHALYWRKRCPLPTGTAPRAQPTPENPFPETSEDLRSETE